jgi:hypothetical protein
MKCPCMHEKMDVQVTAICKLLVRNSDAQYKVRTVRFCFDSGMESSHVA